MSLHASYRSRGFIARPLAAAVAIAAMGSAAPSLAQSRSVLLEEVKVTAQKREEASQDVGIAINVFSENQLEQLGFTKSTDIALMTPGVHIGGSIAGQNSQFTIRGVTQNDFADHTESPIAVFIDDAYVAMAQGQNFAMYDLERVEVLKGPQSTLFGRNATGGLIQYVTRKPTFEPEGFVKLTVGDYEKRELEVAYGGPISDNVAFRISGLYSAHDEILENDYNAGADSANAGVPPGNEFPGLAAEGGGDDLWNDDSQAVRGHLLFNLDDTSELLLTANFFESTLSTGQYQSTATVGVFENFGNPALQKQVGAVYASDNETAAAYDVSGAPIVIPGLRPVPGGDWFGYKDPDGLDPEHFSGDFAFDDLNEIETWGLTANYERELGDMTFVSITDWKEYEKFAAMDVDAAPVNQLSVWWDTEVSQISQEFRLQGNTERMKWVTGFYYLFIDTESTTGFKAAPGSGASLAGVAFLEGSDYPAVLDLETNSYSIFGQLDYDLTDSLTLIAGLRLMLEEKDYTYDQYSVPTNTMRDFANGGALTPIQPGYKDGFEDELWAGKIQLDYRLTPDVLLYAGISRGIKAGSYNAPIDLPIPPVEPSRYDEEVLTSYEAGFKTEWWDGRTRFNGSVFYYDYKDYQGYFFRGVSGLVVNNDSTVTGAEFDFTTSPIDGLDMMAGASFFDAEVEDVEIAPDIFADREPSFAPQMQLTGLIRYSWMMLGGEMAVQWETSYSDEFYYSLRNYDAHLLKSYTVHNARLSYTSDDEKWTVAAYVDNVSDKRYATIGYDISAFCGCSEMLIGEPRWWGIEGKYNFF